MSTDELIAEPSITSALELLKRCEREGDSMTAVEWCHRIGYELHNKISTLIAVIEENRRLAAALESPKESEPFTPPMESLRDINHDDLTRRLLNGESYKMICCNYVDRIKAALSRSRPLPPPPNEGAK